MELIDLKDFHLPKTVDEAAQQMRANEGNSMILGGGTFVHGLVARGLVSHVTSLVDIKRLPLNTLESTTVGVSIGATSTLQGIADEISDKDLPWLSGIKDALVYPPAQIRNAATLGGNLAAGCPFFDLPIVMMSLGAKVHAVSDGASREIDLQDLYVSLFQTTLDPTEFLTAVVIPRPTGRVASSYEKLETNANDLSLVSVGLTIAIGDGGRISSARIIAGGGIGETPQRCSAAEEAIQGKIPSAEVMAEAVAAINLEVDPISDHRASASYRRHMYGVLLEKNLARAISRLN